MKVRKKLFLIFGPILCALMILFFAFSLPFKINFIGKSRLYEASLSQSTNVFKGTQLKKKALSSNYVPFFGSSEWSRIDSFHPAVLAKKFHRNYRPFLLGGRGSQSLSQFWGMQGINDSLKNKRAVFVISPQWFVAQGADPNAFNLYYSNLQSVTWILHVRQTQMNEFAASRLLNMPASHSNKVIELCLMEIAAGQPIGKWQKLYLKVKLNELRNEEELFSLIRMNDRRQEVRHFAKQLPSTTNKKKLTKLAVDQGKRVVGRNRFGIASKFWNHRLAGSYQHLQGKQKKFNYESSPEYADFELVLAQLAQDHTNVLFVIPPVNKKWSNYTGLSQAMLARFDQKITYQLHSQGFGHVANLSDYGGQKYFMTDTIHLGWRGWLKLDSYIKPFLTEPQKPTCYHIEQKFYSKKWQNLHGNQLERYLYSAHNF